MPQCTHVRSGGRGAGRTSGRSGTQIPPTKRPGLSVRRGSNSCLSARISSSAGAGTGPHGSTRRAQRGRPALDDHAAVVRGDEAAQPLDGLAHARRVSAPRPRGAARRAARRRWRSGRRRPRARRAPRRASPPGAWRARPPGAPSRRPRPAPDRRCARTPARACPRAPARAPPRAATAACWARTAGSTLPKPTTIAAAAAAGSPQAASAPGSSSSSRFGCSVESTIAAARSCAASTAGQRHEAGRLRPPAADAGASVSSPRTASVPSRLRTARAGSSSNRASCERSEQPGRASASEQPGDGAGGAAPGKREV